ncbi:acetolactate synthase small subunit [[Clostridium] polysaccharolyticum]|uniref:Acetolactate synthase small subunit n=1 Tax=[Clostridium] polysaccharolyticum TaxID=29364 RepID=A0A1I0E4J6_9FIRM|nr:acetolactate synthase small subunit [[Clostridium] polysaccharolyticum]SET39696.1 acetolactate synthase, small subunit [[Clostridium] polysaccharolyticum]
MKKRWICLFVENEVGVLAKISGLFSAKAYNVSSLTVGMTEDVTISRMTISLMSDDQTFEQIIKQLNRSVEVIKVIDYTNMPIHMEELMYIKVLKVTEKDKAEIFRITKVFEVKVIDMGKTSVLLKCSQTEEKNNSLLNLMKLEFTNRIEVARGGSVAIEAINMPAD